jgi:hypothetical protein
VLAYLSRPEGLLLPMAMVLTLGILPLHRATRINWPRWGAAVAFLVFGSLVLAGPYMALKGSVGTKPAIARVLGLAPMSLPDALERDRPLPADQTALETYRLATERSFKVLRGVVSTPLLPLAALGLLMLRPGPARARTWLFFAVILLASVIGLVRLHATGGYCTARHALIPGVILILAAAHGLTWVMERISISGKWFGMAQERLLPGPAIWAIVLTLLVLMPRCRDCSPPTLGPFLVYRDTGAWLAQNTRTNDRILDLTDWSLYFSRRPGYRFANVYEAPADSTLRWVIARKPHLDGHWNYSAVVRQLVGQREPVALIPANPEPGQLQLRIYDLLGPPGQVATANSTERTESARR